MPAEQTPDLIHYLPIGTTVLSAVFLTLLLRRAALRNWAPHLMWWSIGVFAYGVGTALESSVTLFGNSIELTKAWYIAGAVFGGYPLAQGSVYLHFPRKTAHVLGAISLAFALTLSVAVILSPVDASELLAHKPSGDILQWTWIRFPGTMVINTYAVIFLIGTAAWSALHFLWVHKDRDRAIGNILITVGAILPGVGGSMAKAGIVEALYVGEFVGIILIWLGYTFCVRAPKPTDGAPPADASQSDAT